MKVFEKFDKWEKLWQDGKNEYLRRSYISTEILRTILLKGRKGKTLYRIIDSDDRLFYEGIVNLRITCTTSDIDKLMYIANGVGRKSAAIVEFSKDTLSYEMQKTDSRWTDESEHLTFGKFKVSKKSNEIYINGCDIPLIHFYAEPIDQSVDFAKKLIQKRIGHYREDPLAKRLNDEAIIKMFNESTNYTMNIHESINSKAIFDKILNEKWEHWSGHEPRDGMTGGSWEYYHNCGEYEKEVEVELDGTYYLVYLTMDAELSQGYDDSVGDPYHYDADVDEDSIQLKDIMRELSDEQDVTDPELRNKLFELAKEKLLDDPGRYFENDFYEEPEPPDPPDYEPDDLREAQIKGWHERPVDPPKNGEVGLGSYSEVSTADFDFNDDDGTYYYVVFSADVEAVIDPDTRYININEDSINILSIERETPPDYDDRKEIKNPSPELIEKIKKQIMDDPEQCFSFLYDEMEERYYSQFPEYYGEP